MYPIVEILPQHYKRFQTGHPWLYANEITASPQAKAAEPGAIVSLFHKGRPQGLAYYNRHSLICIRKLSATLHPIDSQFFITRLKRALALRARFYDRPYYRLVFAEGDDLPGIIIDRFDQVLSIQINTQGIEQLWPLIAEALQTVIQPHTLILRRDSPIRLSEGLSICPEEVIGAPQETLGIIENEVRFEVSAQHVQKTGWFFDHRENRKLVAQLSKGLKLIDYFCYSGAFAVQAAVAGARHVVGVDRSKWALENARASARINGVEERCEFVEADVFKDMQARHARGELFDIVVLDPPAFVKQKKDLKPGLRGYEKLLLQAFNLLAPEGLLFIASCSYHVNSQDLKACLAAAAHQAHRSVQLLTHAKTGFDHPLLGALAETDYLKGFLVQCGPLQT